MTLSSFSKSNIGSWRMARIRRSGLCPTDLRPARPGAGGIDKMEAAEGQSHGQIPGNDQIVHERKWRHEANQSEQPGRQECPAKKDDGARRKMLGSQKTQPMEKHPGNRKKSGDIPPQENREHNRHEI